MDTVRHAYEMRRILSSLILPIAWAGFSLLVAGHPQPFDQARPAAAEVLEAARMPLAVLEHVPEKLLWWKGARLQAHWSDGEDDLLLLRWR